MLTIDVTQNIPYCGGYSEIIFCLRKVERKVNGTLFFTFVTSSTTVWWTPKQTCQVSDSRARLLDNLSGYALRTEQSLQLGRLSFRTGSIHHKMNGELLGFK